MRFVILAALAATGTLAAQGETVPAVPLRPMPGQTAGAPPEKTQEELIKLRDEKRALPVFKLADWTFDYDQARARAKDEGKPVFTYFSRSYAH